jgi:hypothetical protein
VLRLTDDAARMRVERTLDKLRATFARGGITSTTGALAVALANQAGATLPAGLAASVTSAAVAGATISGVGVGVAAGTFWTFMSATKTTVGITAVVAVIATGTALYKRNPSDERHTALIATTQQQEKAAEKRAPETRLRPTPPTLPIQSTSAQPIASSIPVIEANQPTNTPTLSYPPMSLSEVLQPNNQFHDALFGVSATFPQGWTVRSARRWGSNNRENTVFLAPAVPSTATPSMYYQNYPSGGPEPGMSEAWLLKVAQTKEDSRSGEGVNDYKNVPSSFAFKQIDGRPSLSYYAVFTAGNEVMTEHFIRILGQKGYVMFFTRGRLEDVQTILPQLEQMAATVRVP